MRDSVSDTIIFSSWSREFQFYNAPTGRYYIVVKHFNTLETWSRAGGDSLMKGFYNNYTFSTVITQVYGNNLKHIGSAYCVSS